MIQYRDHGGEKISTLGLGGCSLGGAYGKKDPAQFAAVVRRAYNLDDFFRGEDIRLQQEQGESIRAILSQELIPERALADLVYLLETLVEGGRMAEADASPYFQQLLGVRDRKDAAVQEQMRAVQSALRDFVRKLDAERRSGWMTES